MWDWGRIIIIFFFEGGGGACRFSIYKKRGACKPYNWLLKQYTRGDSPILKNFYFIYKFLIIRLSLQNIFNL